MVHSPDVVSEAIKSSPYGLPMLSHKGNSWPKTERPQAARAGDGTPVATGVASFPCLCASRGYPPVQACRRGGIPLAVFLYVEADSDFESIAAEIITIQLD
jgi:hypothetical protein